MANHAWATFRKPINPEEWDRLFAEVNKSRLGGLLYMRGAGSVGPGEDLVRPGWFWEFNNDEYHVYFTIWLHKGHRKLEWRHPRGEPSWWAQTYMVHSVIAGINPKTIIRDEGIEDRMEPDFHLLYPKLSDLAKGLDPSPDKRFWQGMFDSLPEKIREVFG